MSKRTGSAEASEASPLLADSAVETAATYIESGESTVGALPSGNGVTDSQTNSYGSNGTTTTKNDDAEEEARLERQVTADSGRDVQFMGMPEVRKQLRYILPALAIGIFLTAVDQTLVASAAGTIGSDLHALKNTSWVATAYFLTLSSFQPLYGKLSDIFGRKPCLLLAYTIFGFGCLWCGLAKTMPEFILARAFAGVGAGGMATVVSIMLSDIIPLRERGTWQGVLNIIFALGAGAGAPLGGLLSDTVGWRWAFIGQFPLCVLAFISVAVALKLPKTDSSHWKTKLRRIDFLGSLTLISAVGTLLVGLDQGSNNSWKAVVTIVCLAVTAPLFGLFVFVEQKIASEPLAPARIIFERSLFASYLCNFFSFAGWFGVWFYIPLYYQAAENLSATQAGIWLLPSILFGVTGSFAGGIIMQKTGRYYWLTVGGYTLLLLSGIPLLLFTGLVKHSTPGILIGLAMGGLGNGSGVTSSLIALISNAAPADQAIATACSYLFRSLGSAIGLSVQSALFQVSLVNYLEASLNGEADAAEITRKVRESLANVRDLSPALQVKVRAAYGESITAVFGLIIVILSGSMFASWFIREKRLSK